MAGSSSVRYPPGEALLALHRRLGRVISTGAGRYGFVYLLGAEANKFVFANSDAFSWRQTFQMLVPIDGPTALIVSDGADHQRRRSMVQPAMHHRQVRQYVATMVANADAGIDGWRQGQRLDIYRQLRPVIRRTVAACLFGGRMERHADFLGKYLQPALNLTHLPPQVMAAQQRLRTPAWRRATAAKARVDAVVDAEIAEARAHGRADDHLMAMLINGRTDAGERLSDNEIRDLVISLIAHGYETTSGAMAWAVHALLTVPGAWDRAAEEVRGVLGDRPPTGEDLRALGYLNGVVYETLRLYTPGVISARKVVRDLWFDGHRIRAGRMVIFSPYVTHRLPELWPEPRHFRPQRWDPQDPGYRKPAPHEFIPFSGGLHRCIGAAMATTEMTVVLARLVARTTLRMPAQRLRAANFAALRPAPGLIVDVCEHRRAE